MTANDKRIFVTLFALIFLIPVLFSSYLMINDTYYCSTLWPEFPDADKATCLAENVIQEDDLSWCEKSSGQVRSRCLIEVAVSRDEPSICPTSGSISWYGQCITRLAQNRDVGSLNLCGRVLEENKNYNDIFRHCLKRHESKDYCKCRVNATRRRDYNNCLKTIKNPEINIHPRLKGMKDCEGLR